MQEHAGTTAATQTRVRTGLDGTRHSQWGACLEAGNATLEAAGPWIATSSIYPTTQEHKAKLLRVCGRPVCLAMSSMKAHHLPAVHELYQQAQIGRISLAYVTP